MRINCVLLVEPFAVVAIKGVSIVRSDSEDVSPEERFLGVNAVPQLRSHIRDRRERFIYRGGSFPTVE